MAVSRFSAAAYRIAAFKLATAVVVLMGIYLAAPRVGAAEGPTININIKADTSGPVFDDQGQKIVRAKNRASQVQWHCNGCDGTQPLSISFTDCRDSQQQPQTCPANPVAHSDKKSVFEVNVAPELEDGTLDYVIKVGEQEVDPSIIVTRAN